MSTDRPNKIAIDKSRHIAQRKAMADWRERQRVFVSRETFGNQYSARVLVSGEYYDVDKNELASLRAGATPTDLELSPVLGD